MRQPSRFGVCAALAGLAVVLAGGCASGGGPAPDPPPPLPAPSGSVVAAEQPPAISAVALAVTPASLRVGDTARVTATAVDAAGATVPGVDFRIRAPRRILGVIEDGAALVAVREGPAEVSAEVRIDALPVRGVARGTASVDVLPAALARIAVEAPDRMYAGGYAVARARATTAIGIREVEPLIAWASSDPAVMAVSPSGGLTALRPGTVRISARSEGVSGSAEVRIVASPVRSLTVAPRYSEEEVGTVIHMSATALDGAGAPVTDATVLWSVASSEDDPVASAQVDSDGALVANAPGLYRVTATFSSLAATAEVRAVPRTARMSMRALAHRTVPAGAGSTTDLWVFEGVDGRDYAYTGTLSAATMYAWDVTDPTSPVLTDSVRLDGRRVNDVKINADATLAVVTSEGASNRRNGITLFDLLNPAHPIPITHFSEQLTGGVHNVWIEGDLVYAVHNGTRDLHIVDVSDPVAPRHVGRWGIDSEGRSLHDVMVKDGLAYLSYWNDGLVILDVGAGISGGTPTEPAFVSQHTYSYPLGAEIYGNTHHAIRYRNWVFVADEIFGCAECGSGPRGYVHVIDVADIRDPREVASFRVPEAGAHNLWVEDDLLYVAYYQAGVRIVDVSGELRGDLWRQGRQVGWFMTGSPTASPPNATMAWGPQPHKGSLFVSDLNSGLWVLEVGPERREPVP